MNLSGPNQPIVVWATCFLWFTSIFAIVWALLLFFTVGDILLMTEMDLVNAFALLAGVIMLPVTVNMLCSIANGNTIDYKSKVMCCPLWLSILWIILINAIAAIVCLFKICSCCQTINDHIRQGMKSYRSVPKYKHFLDTLQWSLKCCGLDSYKDWFSHDWYDRIRDYEWDASSSKHKLTSKNKGVSDSVPLSCCKSGSCISNFLTELGAYSINKSGCAPMMCRIINFSLYVHLFMFVVVVILEVITLNIIVKESCSIKTRNKRTCVRDIVAVRQNFEMSSGSCQMEVEEDSDDEVICECNDD